MEERICIFCKKPFDVNDPYFERERRRREYYGITLSELPRVVCPDCRMKGQFAVKAAGDAHMARLNFGMAERFPWAKDLLKK